MGLYIDLFDPSLFEPAMEGIRLEATPLGHEVSQVNRDPTGGMKAHGPVPFSSCLAPYSVATSFNQGKNAIFN